MAVMTRQTYNHTMQEVAEMIRDDTRIWGYWSAINALAIVWAESSGNAFANPVVIKEDVTHPAHLSMDLGLFGMNSYYQRHIPQRELLIPELNVRHAIDLAMVGGGTPWQPNWYWWTSFRTASHMKHFREAHETIVAVQRFHRESWKP